MPRKYDYEAIIKSYKDLESIRGVSEQLNVPRMTVRAVVYRLLGKCVQCASPVLPGKDVCAKHQSYWADRIAAKRKNRRREGLCQECDEPYALPSKTLCAKHRLLSLKRNETYDKKRSNRLRGSSQGVASSLKQKLYKINENYGSAGIDCFNENEGCCEICGSHFQEVAVHIHHIDEDRNHNTRINFACLCFHCHKAVHQLIDSKNRQQLIAWFERTYPDKPLQ